jgi:hypothetical protein
MAKTSRQPELTTVGDLLYWSYANLGMAEKAVYDGAAEYQQLHFIIRNKLWSGFRKGTMQVGSPVKDLRSKVRNAGHCAYCGSEDHVSMDHVVPKARGGRESGDNILFACRSCNSSRRDRDMIEWYVSRDRFPPLFVLRMYLKEAIRYFQENQLMGRPLTDPIESPFVLHLIPTEFPPPAQLAYRVTRRPRSEKD